MMNPLRWADFLRDPNCSLCPLGEENGDLRCLPGVGPKDAEYMLIGEAPGEVEIRPDVRTPFSGPAGGHLDKLLARIGVDRSTIFISNIVSCRPTEWARWGKKNREPEPSEISACRWLLEAQIKAVTPKKILALGNTPLKALTGKSGIKKYRGVWLPLKMKDGPPVEVMATYHPAYILRNPKFYPMVYLDFRRFFAMEVSPPDVDYSWVRSMDEFKQVASRLLKSPEIAFDLETEGLDPWRGGKIICISLSDQDGYGVVIPLEGEYSGHQWGRSELEYIYRVLGVILSKGDTQLIIFNSKYDLQWLWTRGVKAKCTWDPMVASVLLDENLPHNLEATIQLYLDPNFTKPDPKGIESWPWEKTWPYSAGDADWTMRLYHKMYPLIPNNGMETLFRELLMPTQTKTLPQLELDGIYVVPENLEVAEKECKSKREAADREIRALAPQGYVPKVKSKKARGAGFNPGSSTQLADVLFNEFGLNSTYRTKKDKPSTGIEALTDIRNHHPIVPVILEYRKWDKLQSTYISRWKSEDRDPEGFIHPHYNFFPVTGRLSSNDPDLQNVPKDSLIRSCLGAPPGYVMLRADMSQIELRIAAHYSQDPVMLHTFAEGGDIHSLTASRILGIPYEKFMVGLREGDPKFKKARTNAKPVNFGLVYLMSPEGLMEYAKVEYGVAFTLDEATEFCEVYFYTYKGLLPWHNRQKQFAREHLYVVSMIGRVRHLPNIKSTSWEERSEAERQAINAPVQSLASDMVLMAVNEIGKLLPPRDGWLAGLVHDEALYCIREDRAHYWESILKHEMENPPLWRYTSEKLTVPLEVEIKIAPTWG